MREIKFRVFKKDERKPPNKWMRGPFDLHDFASDQDGEYGDFEFYQGSFEPWTIMQFTGLRDKNGKEIYEGDIVKYTDWHIMPPYDRDLVCEIKYFDRCACFGFGDDINLPRWIQPSRTEVIGNIYENPDLLAGTPTEAK